MVCHNCGNELSKGAQFCRYCGAPTASKRRTARRALASLLIFFIFAGGLAVSGWFTFHTWQELNAPYREAAFASLETELAKAEASARELAELEILLDANNRETRELEDELARYRLQRQTEILSSVTDSGEFDYHALFTTKFFASAYLQYINDLLKAFLQDSLTDSWLYPYYAYSAEYGANARIDQDLWIYGPGEDKKFNGLLADPLGFFTNVYTSDLTDHILQNNQLYVTGIDMLCTLFGIPGYVLDGAVFVKAYGGNPAPEEMEVPGWTTQDYDSFWQSADSYLYSDHAVWEDYGLSAADFDVDWNTLVDEEAYHRAYEKFMDTIAPGLDRYDTAKYAPNDDYYGGVCYELSGDEATLQEIAAAYIAEHPACLAELGIDIDALPSSWDSLISDGEAHLKELAETAAELELQKAEAIRLQNGKDFLLQQQETLLSMQERHMDELNETLLIFALISGFLFLMTVVGLSRFIRALR